MDGDARTRGTRNLVAAGTNRVGEALSAWIADDFDGAASSAPMAVELIAKAVLWSKNPALLVPLDSKQEAALVTLATDPSLDSPTLRTIGLRVALGRLTRVLGDLPVPATRQNRLVDCRNGSLHVGTLPRSGEHSAEVVARQVLADSLTLCDFLLEQLDVDTADFYGDFGDLVTGLLEEKRTELQHRVARRLTKASERLEQMRAHFEDEELWEGSALTLEAAATAAFPPDDFGLEMGGVDQECPTCGYRGRLLGRIGVESDVDVDGGPDGPTYTAYWVLTLYPRSFACNVCKLGLTGPEELEAASLSSAEREVSEEELGDDFHAWEWAEALYGIDD